MRKKRKIIENRTQIGEDAALERAADSLLAADAANEGYTLPQYRDRYGLSSNRGDSRETPISEFGDDQVPVVPPTPQRVENLDKKAAWDELALWDEVE